MLVGAVALLGLLLLTAHRRPIGGAPPSGPAPGGGAPPVDDDPLAARASARPDHASGPASVAPGGGAARGATVDPLSRPGPTLSPSRPVRGASASDPLARPGGPSPVMTPIGGPHLPTGESPPPVRHAPGEQIVAPHTVYHPLHNAPAHAATDQQRRDAAGRLVMYWNGGGRDANAIKQYQGQLGIAQTGLMDPATRTAIVHYGYNLR